MLECGKEKSRKDRIKDKDKESWNNVGKSSDFLIAVIQEN